MRHRHVTHEEQAMAARILPCLIALTFVLSSTGPLTATQPPQQSPISPAAAVPTQDAVSQAIRGNPVLFCENVAQFAGYTRVQSSNGPESIPPYALSSSYDDEFNGPNLNPRWSWFNEDPSRWSLIASSGYIRIVGTTGDMWQSCGNPPKNLLLQEAPTGDFQIWTKLSLHPTINYQSGGLLIFQDLDNYIKLDVLWNNTTQNGESAEFIREQHGASSWPWPWFNVNLSQPAFLKITRSGNTYNGYYGSDGQQWRLVGRLARLQPFLEYPGALPHGSMGASA
jgi:beta-xylosidase